MVGKNLFNYEISLQSFIEIKPEYLIQINKIYSLEIENWALGRDLGRDLAKNAHHSAGKISPQKANSDSTKKNRDITLQVLFN